MHGKRDQENRDQQEHHDESQRTLPELPDSRDRGVVIVISGGRGAGKTTLLQVVRETAQAVRLTVGGFLSVARVREGVKDGIDLMDAATGQVAPLATYQDDLHGAGEIVSTGHYTFDPATLAAGLRYAEAGKAADVFFVDELGPLELERGAGWADVIPLIRARSFGVAFVVVRPKLVALVRERLTLGPDGPVITVDAANRDDVAARLAAWVRQRVD